MRVLVPVDGSERSHRAVKHVIDSFGELDSVEVHLLNVQPPVPILGRLGLRRADTDRKQQQEGQRALRRAQRLLDQSSIRHDDLVAIRPAAETIVRHAKRWKCDSIVIGTRGVGKTPSLALGSVAMKIIHLADCPVTLVN
jgi:nucleotide-binding universal stress UspA family protein